MRCPICREQYDIYNAILDENNSCEWLCPTCGVTLDDSDAKEVYDEISKNDHKV